MKMHLDEQTIALRATKEFEDGSAVNLGYGMPVLCANFILEERRIFFQSENGVLGYSGLATDEEKDFDLINASDQPVIPAAGMCFFDSAASFDMIRGGHIDIVVLGAYQVSERGDLANWGRPGRPATGMGGGMDLAVGARKTIVTMLHSSKDGKPRIVKKCTYPLTAKHCVSMIFTDIAVMQITERGILLREVAPGWTAEEIQALTEPQMIIADDLKEIEI